MRRCQIRDDEFVCLVCALADTSDALHGAYKLYKLVGVQVRGGARQTHKHVWKELPVIGYDTSVKMRRGPRTGVDSGDRLCEGRAVEGLAVTSDTV